MIIIVCVDRKNGMSFYGRRQTKDRVVQERILQEAYPGKVIMSHQCAAGFPAKEQSRIICRSNPMEAASDGYCMIETESLYPFADRLERVILYRWDTIYPADVYFDLPLDAWVLVSETYLDGYSHPDVRREVYVRKERK